MTDEDLSAPTTMPEFLIRHATLRQLQVFEAIVRLGSFTRAAEELFLTQPTVSMQIKKLSSSTGLALFEQKGRSVKPTDAGHELYAACREIFQTLSNLEMKIAEIKGIQRGRLRLGVISTAKYVAPQMLGEFSKLHPGIELALKVTNRERILERIQSNEDDLYIMGQAPDKEIDVEVFPFSPNPLVMMASRDHPLVGKKNITLEEIAEEPFILREPGSGTRDVVLRRFQEKGLKPNVKMELGSNEAIKHAVAVGLGITVLSLHTLTLEGANGPVVLLDVEGFPIERKWYLVYPKGKTLSVVSQAFLEFALETEPKIHENLNQLLAQLGQPAIKPTTRPRRAS